MGKKSSQNIIKNIFIGILGFITLIAAVLALNTKFNLINHKFFEGIYIDLVGRKLYHEFEETLGPSDRMFTRTAQEEAEYIAEKLNTKVIFDGIQNIPTEGGFVMIVNEYSILDGCFLAYMVNYARKKNDAKLFRIQQYPNDNRGKYSLPVAQFGKFGNQLVEGGVQRVVDYLKDGHPVIIVPSGKYDQRFFDISDFFRYRSGFLRFAKEAQVGILPVYIHLKLPLWMKFINTIAPALGETIIHTFGARLFKNAMIRITVGELIEYSDVMKDDLSSESGYPKAVLNKYSDAVFSLQSRKLENNFYANID